MRSSVIIELIKAHFSNDEVNFDKIIKKLCYEENKKGNTALSQKILETYNSGKSAENTNAIPNKSNFAFNNNSIFQQDINYTMNSSSTLMPPKDKDSLLSLYEIIIPDESLNEVILPNQQKELLYQIIQEYNQKEKLYSLNLTPTNRVLLCGPPGCGKTMTAKAIAHELKLPMAYVRLDALISSYLGQTGTNLRKIFDSVKGKNIVLFLDEFDSIAKKRDDGQELGELKRVVTTLLQNFDMLDNNVFLIAATNHEHLLDSAIWRRFNTIINISLPNLEQREQLLKIHLKNYNFHATNTLSITKLAKVISGISCSQIDEIIQQTAKRVLFTLKRKSITSDDVILSFIKYVTNNSITNSLKYDWKALFNIKNNGIPLRLLEEATGIPKSTISDNLNKIKMEENKHEK